MQFGYKFSDIKFELNTYLIIYYEILRMITFQYRNFALPNMRIKHSLW